MPELPEVETVRLGLQRWVVGQRVARAEVLHPRAVRRHAAGAADFCSLLADRTVRAARRRGKYLWLPLDSGDALVAHLGMSGQLRVVPETFADGAHLRVRLVLAGTPREVRFIDQRTFGGLSVAAHGAVLPASLGHIALDPLDPDFAPDRFVARLLGRRTGLKRALLDQTLISGIGAIYADEALWRARLHWAAATESLESTAALRLVVAVREVLVEAVAAGGTSFDALYVDVEGRSGYFERSLSVYGRQGRPCPRCGCTIVRERWMNRSAYSCPSCQPMPVDRRF